MIHKAYSEDVKSVIQDLKIISITEGSLENTTYHAARKSAFERLKHTFSKFEKRHYSILAEMLFTQ